VSINREKSRIRKPVNFNIPGYDDRVGKLKEITQGWSKLLPHEKYPNKAFGTRRVAVQPSKN